jgi:hypothetical protein
MTYLLLVPFITYTLPLFIAILGIYAFAAYRESKDLNQNTPMSLKKIYLYLVSTIAIFIAMIGGIMTLNVVLENIITPASPLGYQSSSTSTLPIALSMLIVGCVVWAIHWVMARKEV